MENVLTMKVVFKDAPEAEIWAAGMKTLHSNGVRYFCLELPNGTVEGYVLVLRDGHTDVLGPGERRLIFNNILE